MVSALILTQDVAKRACRLYGGGKPATKFHRLAFLLTVKAVPTRSRERAAGQLAKGRGHMFSASSKL